MPPKKKPAKTWSVDHEKKFNWLFNYMKKQDGYEDINKEDFIDVHRRDLSKFISENKNWGEGSREGMYFMIARYLLNKQQYRYSRIYSQLGYDELLKIQGREAMNQLDEKEKESYRPHQYFVDILDSIDFEKIQTKEEHYKYLLLSLVVKQPPLRTDFYVSAKLIKAAKDNDTKNNFVLVNKRGKIKASLIVNHDKASNYKMYNINKNLSKIPIEDDNLAKLISASYDNYPRNYLFEINNNPISQQTFIRWLRDISGVPGLTNDIMRSSYITWFYEQNLVFKDRDKLSKIMRHSMVTAQKNYNKVFETEKNADRDVNETLALKKTIGLLNAKVKELEIKLSAHEDNNDDIKQVTKKVNDILYNLNTKGREPRPDTLIKYNIRFDDSLNKYVRVK